MFAADTRLLFGSIYNLQLQAGGSRTVVGGRAITAPIWQAIFNRDGRHFGYRYQTTGIHEDFQAASGFISRGGIITTNLTHRATWFGAADAPLQSWTTSVLMNGVWQYRAPPSGSDGSRRSCTSTTPSSSPAAGRPAPRRCSSRSPSTRCSTRTTRSGPGGPTAPAILPFTGVPHIRNDDYVVTLNTPQFSRFSGSVFLHLGARRELLRVVAGQHRVRHVSRRLAAERQAAHRARSISCSPTSGGAMDRRSASGRIPRLKVEYQVSRPIFLRVIGEYDAQQAGRAARRFAHQSADSDSRSGDRTLCAGSRVRAQPVPRRRAVLVSADAGHRGVRRLQQPPDGTAKDCDSVACDVQTTVFFSRSAICSGCDAGEAHAFIASGEICVAVVRLL